MPEKKIFGLRLNKSPNLYYPGDTVSGKVILDFPKEKSVFSVTISVIGTADVGFMRNSSVSRFVAHRSYIHRDFTLAGGITNQKIKIPAGRQEYPFSFELPTDIPSSIKSAHGKVGYCIEITVRKKPMGSGSKSDVKTSPQYFINVHSILDLNAEPTYKDPVSVTLKRRVGSEEEQVINCTFKAAKGGFIPGELLLGSIEIDNSNCPNPIKETKMHLVQRTTAIAKHITAVSKSIIVSAPPGGETQHDVEEKSVVVVMSLPGPSVAAGERKNWELDKVCIPNIPPTQTNRDHLILIQYDLQVEMKPPKGSIANLYFPIVIGTIPIQTQSNPAQSVSSQEMKRPTDLPPPYEAATAGN